MASTPDPLASLLVFALLASLALLLFLPGRGLLARWRRARRLGQRALLEDALKHLHRGETHRQPVSLPGLAVALGLSPPRAARLLQELQARGLISVEGEALYLTTIGREAARRVVRAHRLWEEHLAEQTGIAAADWHELAERHEHLLSAQQAQSLAASLGNPSHDPHGDPIPTPNGDFQHHPGQPLASLPLHTPLRIVHLEDEPPAVYARLVAEGLYPGMAARLTESTPLGLRLWAGGAEHLLPPDLAANVSALPLPEQEIPPEDGLPLSDLRVGERGRVIALSPRFRGAERRRLLDLGLLPGTLIEPEMASPSGDPTAYRIRGALIALRREQAQGIRIEKVKKALPV
jgi:DtxR family Mn-dependent transcriptional regulator